MSSFLARKISRKIEMVFLAVVLAEALLLFFSVLGIKNDLARNLNVIGGQAGSRAEQAQKELDGFSGD